MQEHACASDKGSSAKVSLRVGPLFTPFSAQSIPDACLEHVIEMARLAPSEWNFQPWRWIVVRSEAAKQHLEGATYIQAPISSAPAILICLADTLAWKSAPQHLQEMVESRKISEAESLEALRRLREYYSASPEVATRTALANTFVALHQILLAAAECNLCAYWVTEFNELKIKTHFHIPDHFLVAALLPIGYQNETPPPSIPKLPLRTLIYDEKFGETLSR